MEGSKWGYCSHRQHGRRSRLQHRSTHAVVAQLLLLPVRLTRRRRRRCSSRSRVARERYFFTALYDSAATEINAANFLPSHHRRCGASLRSRSLPHSYIVFSGKKRQLPRCQLAPEPPASTGFSENGFLPNDRPPRPRSPEIVLFAEDVTVPFVTGQLSFELHAALGALQAARVPLPLHRREVKLVHDAQPATRAQRRRRRCLPRGNTAADVGHRFSRHRRGTYGAVVLAPRYHRRRHHCRVFHGAARARARRRDGGGATVEWARDPVVLTVARPDPASVIMLVRGPGMRRWRRRSARRRGSRRCRRSSVATKAHGLTAQVLLLMLLKRMKRSGRGRWVRQSLK